MVGLTHIFELESEAKGRCRTDRWVSGTVEMLKLIIQGMRVARRVDIKRKIH
jgi:hypothetical protein